jgi:hypothetical protein
MLLSHLYSRHCRSMDVCSWGYLDQLDLRSTIDRLYRHRLHPRVHREVGICHETSCIAQAEHLHPRNLLPKSPNPASGRPLLSISPHTDSPSISNTLDHSSMTFKSQYFLLKPRMVDGSLSSLYADTMLRHITSLHLGTLRQLFFIADQCILGLLDKTAC